MNTTTFTIYNAIAQLPNTWDTVAIDNAFLQTSYLKVLEESAPTNMQCFYIGIFENGTHTGVALAQYLDVHKLESFGERDQCLKTTVRNFVFKNFAAHVLFLGNNMITGQNGYAFSKPMEYETLSKLLLACASELRSYFKKLDINIHIISFKDFYTASSNELKKHDFATIFEFSAQPNMIFNLDKGWKTETDYVNAFSKKYRDQYKRARKKFEGTEVRELTYKDILQLEDRIYELYHYVAKNAPFNTFFLAPNHFSTFKKCLEEQLRVCGYFWEGKLVGFHTILLNGKTLETYFLGYDEEIQKEKMLYLNMLYNMTRFGIEHQFENIIFGRTALEIKSSIGAEPVLMSGFILHTNKFINKHIGKFFNRLEPTVAWQKRHPFK